MFFVTLTHANLKVVENSTTIMKLITLNTWGGKVKEPLTSFLKAHQDADVFCFQEIFHDAEKKTRGDFGDAHLDLYNEMKSLLPEMSGYFCPTVDDYYGIATFVKKISRCRHPGT